MLLHLDSGFLLVPPPSASEAKRGFWEGLWALDSLTAKVCIWEKSFGQATGLYPEPQSQKVPLAPAAHTGVGWAEGVLWEDVLQATSRSSLDSIPGG